MIKNKQQFILPEISREVLDSLPFGVYVINGDGAIEYFNPKMAEISGVRDAEEIVGQNVFKIPNYKKYKLDKYFASGLKGNPFRIESIKYVSYTGKKESVRHYNGIPVKDRKGKVQKLLCIVEDVTESKQAEVSLKENFECFQKLVKTMFEGTIIMEKGIVIDVNESFLAMTGFNREEIIGKSVLDLIAEESKKIVKENTMSEYNKPYEVKGLKKDGTEINVLACGVSIVYQGRPARIAAIRDITEQKKSEKKLRENEEKWNALIRSTTDSILNINENGKILFFNHPLPGATREEITGKTVYDFIPPEQHIITRNSIKKVIATKETVSFESKAAAPNGPTIWFYTRLSPIIKNGKVESIVQISTDISKRKSAEKELEERNKELERFNKLIIDREITMIELKRKIKLLEEKTKESNKIET